MTTQVLDATARLFDFIGRFFTTAQYVGVANAWRVQIASRFQKDLAVQLGSHHFRFRGKADLGVMSHFYEPMFAIRSVRPLTAIVDLGAHIGDETFKFAMRHPEAKIVGLEPSPSNFALAQHNTRDFDNVTIFNEAIGTEEGEAWLFQRLGDTAEGFFVGQTADAAPGATMVAKVRVVTMDDLLSRCTFGKVDIVKMDIEGMEDTIFFSKNAWIDRVSAVIVETRNPRIVSLMCEKGFETYHCGENFVFIRADAGFQLEERRGYT